jgi:hypothetical protein
MPNPTRAASVAAIHASSINASRKKCGLPPLAAAELEVEFYAVNHAPVRKAGARRKFSSTGGADSMWGSIVQKLNASLPSSRPPIAAGHPSPESSDGDGRVDAVVDWSALARNLNASAGLRTPVRR